MKYGYLEGLFQVDLIDLKPCFNLRAFSYVMAAGEKERASLYIHVPSPAGLIGWNIQHIANRSTSQHVQQRHYGHQRLTNVVNHSQLEVPGRMAVAKRMDDAKAFRWALSAMQALRSHS